MTSLLLSILVGLGSPLAAQEQGAAATKLIDDYVAQKGVVGVSVAVVVRGRLVFARGAGFADREAKRPVATDTLFRLGSISKSVTAVGLMKLVEKGSLSLSDTLEQRVPEWPAGRPAVTLEQLLSHTGGVRHYKLGNDPTGSVFRTYSTAEAAKLIGQDPLLFEPGTKESYSTHAYTLLARAIEKASGQEFVAYMRSGVFPTGHQELDCEVLADAKPARSALYTLTGGTAKLETRREDNSWKYGGGGMEATARGLAIWADSVRAGKLLGPSALETMWTSARLKDGKPLAYGLGWGVRNRVVGHTGAQQGCRSSLSIDRDQGLSVVVLTNTGGNHSPGDLGKAVGALWSK